MANLPYVVTYFAGHESFESFAEALARYREMQPGNYAPSIHNSDRADFSEGGNDGLTEGEQDQIFDVDVEFYRGKKAV